MLLFPDARLEDIVIHRVGNKSRDEGVHLSKTAFDPDDDMKNLLMAYFLSPFKSNELYNLQHDTDIRLNEIFSYVSDIFDDPGLLYDQSVNIANHLYAQSVHPKVEMGELYVVYFRQCLINDEEADAVGIFKSESKDTFIKVYSNNENYNLEKNEGININRLDKGCLIFNTEKDRGYVVAVVDNLGRGQEAMFWKDNFLHLCERNDDFFKTKEAIKLCKSFVADKMPQDFEVSKVDQAEFLNKSIAYFKEKDEFTLEEFTTEVIKQPELIESFNDFKQEYEEDHDLKFSGSFNIDDSAVKQQSKFMKSIIKLDKNFHIYVHGGRDQIKKGFDEEKGLNFYQLYYKDEK